MSRRLILSTAERIREAGVGLRGLAEPWADTTTPAGGMVSTVFAGIAEFERSLIIERDRVPWIGVTAPSPFDLRQAWPG
ncbi:hypothetical protein Rru_B0013 (plasmid) [Rhodospirillum rubrum ATCC 11170]|uniref:Resolvase/invertase-type recombinase catalytic domain-containing protein n=1 Tax=Rhodospirillum rubrum (strain ATCC 11170 / ATH 1.1.1 / DSM 467 / LMG 4362 / NCIMB 8255 / S1) TaxID=269796 RepID=Q2RMN6_RHORT|nr:hypothetical protein Rru_B0013 [Rhodospirillum rubrum ATCC 11170]